MSGQLICCQEDYTRAAEIKVRFSEVLENLSAKFEEFKVR